MGQFGSKGGLSVIAPVRRNTRKISFGEYLTCLSKSVEVYRDEFGTLSRVNDWVGDAYRTKNLLLAIRPDEIRHIPKHGQRVLVYMQRGSDELVGVETTNGDLVYRNEDWIRDIERHNRLYR